MTNTLFYGDNLVILRDMFPDVQFQVIGEPATLDGARQLAEDNRYQFQWWALSLVRARPASGQESKGKKGKDQGVDGIITFIDEAGGKPKQILIQVKSGKVKSGDVRDLRGTVERENAAMGVFVTLEPPSREMQKEAIAAGFYHSPGWNQDYPKMQILTIGELLAGATVKMPPTGITFKQAPKAKKELGQQAELGL